MMTPQIILFLDTSGVPHAETVGKNGSRTKIDLGEFWTDRNPELMAELQSQAYEQQLERNRIAEHEAEVARRVAEANATAEAKRLAESIEIANRNNIPNTMREWQIKYDSADPYTQFKMAITAAEARDKIKRLEEQRAKQLYQGLASKHDIHVANRVIDDKSRRPNKRLAIRGGGSYNGRTEKQFDKNGKEVNKKRNLFKGSSNGQVVRITL